MFDAKVQSPESPKPVGKGGHLLSLRQSAPKMVILTLFGFTALITAAQPTHAATVGTSIGGTPFVNICTAGVTLPTLTPITAPVVAPVTGVLTGLLNGLGLAGLTGTVTDLTSAVTGLTTSVDSNVITPLSGTQLSLGVLGNDLTATAALANGNCNVATTGLGVTNNQGITIGGGQIAGLGGTASLPASAGDLSAIAFGNGATTSTGSVNAIAVGPNATANATGAVALGGGATASTGATNAIALGQSAAANGMSAIAVGGGASAVGTGTVALGSGAVATAAGGVALGQNSTDLRTAITVAVADPTALASAPRTVTTTTGAVSVGTVGGERQIVNVAAGTTPTDAVNVAQITPLTTAINGQVAESAGVVAALGGGAAYNSTLGVFTPPAYTVGGLTYTNVGGAIGAQNTVSTNTGAGVAAALGGGSTYIAANGTVTTPTYTVDGANYTNIGAALAASNANAPVKYSTVLTPTVANNGVPTQDVTLVGASVLAPVGLHNVAAGALLPLSTDAVNGSQLYATGSTLAAALGGATTFNTSTGALSTPTFSVGGNTYGSVGTALLGESNIVGLTGANLAATIGGGATYTAATGLLTSPNYTIDGTVYTNIGAALGAAANNGPVQYSNGGVLGNGGTPTQSETLVGLVPGVAVALHNVAPGAVNALSTDAINGAQLNSASTSVALALGGGSTVNTTTGAITTPTYTINGTVYTSVGSALLAAGNDGPVQYSNPGTPTVGNGGTATQSETLVGALPGAVALHNVAAGSLAALSTDAVNGGQVNTAANSVALALGGGTTFNATTGALTGTSFTVGGLPYTNVGAAIGAENGIVNATGATLAAGVGGGAIYNPATGAISTPSLTVDGQLYTNLGSAVLAAANNGPVQYSNPGTPTTGNGGTPTQSETLVGALAGVPVGLHNVAAGVLSGVSTDAVNGAQLYATGASTASALGGTSTYDAATGQVSAPVYTVGGVNFSNVGAAISAQNTISHNSETGLTTALGGGATYNPATGVVVAPTYVVGANTYTNVGAAITAAASGVGTPVQYSTALAPTTANGGVPSQDVTLVGALNGLPVALHNVAPGALAGGSTDAVNGGQLYAVGATLAMDLGGGATLNPLTGLVSAPSYTVGGMSYGNVGLAIGAQNTISGNSEAGLTAALGGGASYNAATGAVTGPTYTVGANSYTNVGAAIDAAAAGVGTPVQYSTALAPTTANGGAPSQDVTLVGALAGVPVALHNVAAGALNPLSTDAVNGAQLYGVGSSLASALGGGATLDPLTGQVSAPSYTVGGVPYIGVSAAIGAQNAISGATGGTVAAALGGGTVYNAATGAITAPTYTIGANVYTNVGAALAAAAAGVGTPAQYSTALAPTTANGGIPSQDVTLVGALAGAPVALHNLAAGALTPLSTDAVNGGQLYAQGSSLATALGGGAALDPLTGQVSTPVYSVGGLPYVGVGAAITAQSGISGATGASVSAALGGLSTYNAATGAVGAPTYTVGANVYTNVGSAIEAAASGVGMPVQYSTALAPTTANPGVPSQDVTLVGALPSAPVALHNLAPGALTALSTDAVNGGQLYATGSSLASALGGGATLDPLTGQVSAPVYTVGGSPYVGVGAAITAQSAISGASGAAVSAALGGGSTYIAGTGAVTAPTYTVGGQIYSNVGAAIDAAAAGGGLPVQYSTAQAPTTGNPGVPSQDVTLVGALPGAPVALHNVANGALAPLSTDAVNGGQLYATGASLASALGGGATLDPLTGAVSAPIFTVGGLAYTNVGAAIGAQSAISGATGAGLSAALGGGSTYVAATGAVTAPTYTVGGQVYTNVGSAIDAAAAGPGGVVQYSTALAPTTANGGVPSQDATLIGAIAGAPVALHNVANGALTASSTDAVNGGQLYATGSSLASALGGGTTYNTTTGTVSTPAYVVGANTYNDVGAAITAAASGVAGPVQYSSATAPTTANGGVTSQDEFLVGADASLPVTLHNLAAGSLAQASTDAVNGGQLYSTGSSLASALGGGSTFSTSTGLVGAPNYIVQNTNYSSVGGAISALDTGLASLQTPGSEYFHANSTGTDSSATGTNAVAIGVGNTAVGTNALAAGANATAMNAGSTALGSGAVAGSSANGSTTNTQNTAVGVNSSATGVSTTALGASATAMGTSSVALGTSAVAMDLSTAIGNAATTMATASVAIGDGAKAGDSTAPGVNLQAGVAIGVVSTAMARATAVGNGSGAMGFGSTAIGASAMAMDTGSTAIGQYATANGASSIALGTNSTAAAESTAIGDSSTTMASGSIALGVGAKSGDANAVGASQQAGVAVGVYSTAMGNGTALGNSTTATGQGSSAVGQSANAVGANATAVGINATAMTDNSVAVGSQATAGGGSAVSVGYQNTAMGNGAVAVGDPDTAMGEGATAIGENETATGDGTVAIGDGNTATGQGAVTLGYFSNALGAGSLAFGDTATAALQNDIALGTNSAASGGSSLALGAGAAATNAFGVALGSGSVDGANNNTAGTITAGPSVNLTYDNAANTLVGALSVGSAGAYRQIQNVADGVAAHDAVTVEQLASVVTQTNTAITLTNQNLANLATIVNNGTGAGTGTGTTAVSTSPVQYATAAAPTTATTPVVATSNDATLVGQTAAPVGLHNLAAGALTAASTDAVNGSQLFATNAAVAGLATTQNGVAVNSALGPASAAATETAALGGGAIANGAGSLAMGSGATATGANSVALGSGSTDGGQTGVVSVGSATAQRRIVNVAAGGVTAGSTDAVNGGQLYTVSQQSANAVQYGTDANGNRTNTVALVGGNAAAPVVMTNVAAGSVTAASTDAVNGAQLYGVGQTAAAAQTTANAAQVTATQAQTLAANSMQYDDATHTSATLNSGGAATTLHNVGAGTANNDAANIGQLNAAMASAVSTSNAYTDTRFNQAMNSIWKVKQEAYAATAGAMAAAGLPQAHGTGKTLVSMAIGAWEGQTAYALGGSRLSDNGKWIVKGSVSFNTQGQGGANVGVGFEF